MYRQYCCYHRHHHRFCIRKARNSRTRERATFCSCEHDSWFPSRQPGLCLSASIHSTENVLVYSRLTAGNTQIVSVLLSSGQGNYPDRSKPSDTSLYSKSRHGLSEPGFFGPWGRLHAEQRVHQDRSRQSARFGSFRGERRTRWKQSPPAIRAMSSAASPTP